MEIDLTDFNNELNDFTTTELIDEVKIRVDTLKKIYSQTFYYDPHNNISCIIIENDNEEQGDLLNDVFGDMKAGDYYVINGDYLLRPTENSEKFLVVCDDDKGDDCDLEQPEEEIEPIMDEAAVAAAAEAEAAEKEAKKAEATPGETKEEVAEPVAETTTEEPKAEAPEPAVEATPEPTEEEKQVAPAAEAEIKEPVAEKEETTEESKESTEDKKEENPET